MKYFLTELAWLLLALVLSFLLAGYIADWKFSGDITFHFYDTYYVVIRWMIILPLFSFIAFLLFLLKEIRNGFGKALPAIIIFCSGVLSIVSLSLVMKFMPVISGYTMYPPLSALSDNWINVGYDREMTVLFSIIAGMQMIVAIICIYVAYRLGTAKRKVA